MVAGTMIAFTEGARKAQLARYNRSLDELLQLKQRPVRESTNPVVGPFLFEAN